MPRDSEGYYAHIRWHPEDVKTLRPNWTLEQCEKALARVESHIQDRSVEYGWDIIRILLDDVEDEIITPGQAIEQGGAVRVKSIDDQGRVTV